MTQYIQNLNNVLLGSTVIKTYQAPEGKGIRIDLQKDGKYISICMYSDGTFSLHDFNNNIVSEGNHINLDQIEGGRRALDLLQDLCSKKIAIID